MPHQSANPTKTRRSFVLRQRKTSSWTKLEWCFSSALVLLHLSSDSYRSYAGFIVRPTAACPPTGTLYRLMHFMRRFLRHVGRQHIELLMGTSKYRPGSCGHLTQQAANVYDVNYTLGNYEPVSDVWWKCGLFVTLCQPNHVRGYIKY